MPGTYGSAATTPSPRKKPKLSDFFGMSRNKGGVFTKISPTNHTNNPSNKKQPDIGAMMQSHLAVRRVKKYRGMWRTRSKARMCLIQNFSTVYYFLPPSAGGCICRLALWVAPHNRRVYPGRMAKCTARLARYRSYLCLKGGARQARPRRDII